MGEVLLALILALGLAAAPAHAQLSLTGAGPAGAGAAACTTYPLDGLTATPIAAYGTRKLRSAYAGNILQLIRASDSTTQDFGATGCNLNSTTSFCASTTCRVKILYDQSGNGLDISQASAGAQPSFSATQNGHPVLTCTKASSQFLRGAQSTTLNVSTNVDFSYVSAGAIIAGAIGGQPGNILSKSKADDTVGHYFLVENNLNNGKVTGLFSTAYISGTLSDIDSVWRTMMMTVTRSTTTAAFFASGSAQGSGSNAAIGNNLDSTAGGLNLCGGQDSALYISANIGQVVFFSGTGGALSSGDRTTIFNADSTYWGAN